MTARVPIASLFPLILSMASGSISVMLAPVSNRASSWCCWPSFEVHCNGMKKRPLHSWSVMRVSAVFEAGQPATGRNNSKPARPAASDPALVIRKSSVSPELG